MFTPTAFETGIMTRIAGPRERVKISVKKKKKNHLAFTGFAGKVVVLQV